MFTLARQQMGRVWYFVTYILLLQLLPIGLLAAPTANNTMDAVAVTVEGTVTDQETGEPLPEVNVLVKGTGIGTATDIEGKYALNVPEGNAVLLFSFIGYVSQEIPVNNRTIIDVGLQGDFGSLNEVVVTGYSSERVVDLTGAVSVVDTKALANRSTNNPIQSLQGQIAGVYVTTNGNPSGSATVRVRGVTTLNNNDPLYVIDGVPTKSSAFNVLNPNDIESIQVLKDASSAAIYGARASNGVIIVTTKQAQDQGIQVNYSSTFTHSSYSTKPDVLNTEQRARVQWQAMINDGLDPDEIPVVDYDWTRNSDG